MGPQGHGPFRRIDEPADEAVDRLVGEVRVGLQEIGKATAAGPGPGSQKCGDGERRGGAEHDPGGCRQSPAQEEWHGHRPGREFDHGGKAHPDPSRKPATALAVEQGHRPEAQQREQDEVGLPVGDRAVDGWIQPGSGGQQQTASREVGLPAMRPADPGRDSQPEERQADAVEHQNGGLEGQCDERDHRQGEWKRVGIAGPDEEVQPLGIRQGRECGLVVWGVAHGDQLRREPEVVEIVVSGCAAPRRPADPPDQWDGDGHGGE